STVPNPVAGIVAPSAATLNAKLDSLNEDYRNGFITGRRPLSELEEYRQAWLSGGGQTLCDAFTEALDEASCEMSARVAPGTGPEVREQGPDRPPGHCGHVHGPGIEQELVLDSVHDGDDRRRRLHDILRGDVRVGDRGEDRIAHHGAQPGETAAE